MINLGIQGIKQFLRELKQSNLVMYFLLNTNEKYDNTQLCYYNV